MKVFVSWSKARSISHRMALFLREWIPSVLQAVEPYMSAEDIGKGESWFINISEELKASTFGVICITKENMHSEWIHFEAGAIYNSVGRAHVCPLLIDLSPSELQGPLSQFQSTLTSKDEIFKLLKTLNQGLDRPVSEHMFRPLFDTMWPKFEKKLKQLNTSNKDKEHFWQVLLDGIPPSKGIYTVLTAKQGVEWENGKPTSRPGHTAQLTYNEVSAFSELQKTLFQFKRNLRVVHSGIEDLRDKSSNVPDFSEDETLILIGSPHANQLCKRIMSSSKLIRFPFRFEVNKWGKCINIYCNDKGDWFDSPVVSLPARTDETIVNDDLFAEDFGAIIRITNPIDASGKNKVLILAGNHGFGTESAVNYVADDERVQLLHNIVKEHDFAALFEASVGRKRGLSLGLRRVFVLRDGKWQNVEIP